MRQDCASHTGLVGDVYWSEFLSFLVGGKRRDAILDVGCGDCELTEELTRLFNSVTAFDRCDVRRRSHASIDFELADVSGELPAKWRGRFDLASAYYVLQHLATPAALRSAFENLAACLQPHGHLCVAIPHPCFAAHMRLNQEKMETELKDYMQEGRAYRTEFKARSGMIEMSEYHYPLQSYITAAAPHFLVSRVAEPVALTGQIPEELPLVCQLPFALFIEFISTRNE